MRGNPTVITKLNEALREELTAINQYFVHAEMCHNWGYHRLGNAVRKQSIGEMKHAEELMERIIFLDGMPSMQPLALTVGHDVQKQIQNDLDLELKAVTMYNDAIRVARESGDNTSRELFERLLKDEEAHVDFLEMQLHQIQQLGYERYLAQQIEGEDHCARDAVALLTWRTRQTSGRLRGGTKSAACATSARLVCVRRRQSIHTRWSDLCGPCSRANPPRPPQHASRAVARP